MLFLAASSSLNPDRRSTVDAGHIAKGSWTVESRGRGRDDAGNASRRWSVQATDGRRKSVSEVRPGKESKQRSLWQSLGCSCRKIRPQTHCLLRASTSPHAVKPGNW
ncbi:hypothetical protein AB1N83_014291 [Pleurotus pulmonarius]